jgi:hypothetical protein
MKRRFLENKKEPPASQGVGSKGDNPYEKQGV